MGLDEWLNISRVKGISLLVMPTTVLVARRDALTAALELQNRGVRLLGMEGFNFDGVNLIPDPDAIADFSESHTDGSYASAVDMLSGGLQGIQFIEFVTSK